MPLAIAITCPHLNWPADLSCAHALVELFIRERARAMPLKAALSSGAWAHIGGCRHDAALSRLGPSASGLAIRDAVQQNLPAGITMCRLPADETLLAGDALGRLRRLLAVERSGRGEL